jgi:hypothetical protein
LTCPVDAVFAVENYISVFWGLWNPNRRSSGIDVDELAARGFIGKPGWIPAAAQAMQSCQSMAQSVSQGHFVSEMACALGSSLHFTSTSP